MKLNKECKEKFENCNGFLELEYDFKSLGSKGRRLTFKVPNLESYTPTDVIVLTDMIFEKLDEIFNEQRTMGDKYEIRHTGSTEN